jgi:cell division protein FtsX
MIGFLAFSVRRAFQGLWRNRVMSLAATVTMVLMLVLLAGLCSSSPASRPASAS